MTVALLPLLKKWRQFDPLKQKILQPFIISGKSQPFYCLPGWFLFFARAICW